MEAYKEYLCNNICLGNKTIEEVDKTICNKTRFTINRNEEGKIHSRYLGDRYEPAIIYRLDDTICVYYYLFDGDIKDCEHPFSISYYNEKILNIIYYSSERIRNGEPNIIGSFYTYYNNYKNIKILDEYESKYIKETKIIKDVTLCDEIENDMFFIFKFAD